MPRFLLLPRNFLLPLSFLLPLLLCSCTGSPELVSQYGGMREVLRKGDTEARISFEEIRQQSHAIGVGALSELQGEITILDGQIYVATTTDGVNATTTSGHQHPGSATLLTLAHVSRWHQDPLPDSVPLEQAIEIVAKSHGLDSDKPFPFIIEGIADSFELHVINGFCPIATPDLAPEDQPWRSRGSSTPIKVVGFFAKNQTGVITHHGSNLHIHAIIDDGEKITSGHLDQIKMKSGSLLSVPNINNSTS